MGSRSPDCLIASAITNRSRSDSIHAVVICQSGLPAPVTAPGRDRGVAQGLLRDIFSVDNLRRITHHVTDRHRRSSMKIIWIVAILLASATLVDDAQAERTIMNDPCSRLHGMVLNSQLQPDRLRAEIDGCNRMPRSWCEQTRMRIQAAGRRDPGLTCRGP